jgi:nucleoside-diphosphate-sugar epimerase
MDILICYNETHTKTIQIYAAGRNEKKMHDRFSEFFDRAYFHFIPYDASRADNHFDFPCDYVIHGAANSSPKKIVKEPVETMLSNFLGMKYLLDFAREKETKRILYISSSEVYGKKERKGAAKESDYGYIDILLPRNSYSIGKQAAETLCISYADEYGLDPIIIRPGHIYGPTANRTDDHVSSSWAYDVASGKDIIMKSDGAQIRSYVYCLDCASAILKVLLCGEKGRAYNISNPASIISIKEMAELLCDAAGVRLHVEQATAEEKKGFNPMNDSSIDSSSLLALGWNGCFDAKMGFYHTVEILKELYFSKN